MADAADRLLFGQHQTDLAKSGLTADDARSHGWYSTADPAEIARLLNWKPGPAVERLGPCLVFPHPGAATTPSSSPTARGPWAASRSSTKARRASRPGCTSRRPQGPHWTPRPPPW